jgi:hypothetical protein
MRMILLSLAFAAATSAWASNELLTVSNPSQILAFHIDLLQQLKAETVEGLEDTEADKLAHRATQATQLLTGVEQWSEISQENQLQVFNLHEEVRVLLAKAGQRGEEKVCKMQRLTGTQIPKTVCRTRAAIEQDKQLSRDGLREMQGKHPGRPNL